MKLDNVLRIGDYADKVLAKALRVADLVRDRAIGAGGVVNLPTCASALSVPPTDTVRAHPDSDEGEHLVGRFLASVKLGPFVLCTLDHGIDLCNQT